MAAPDTGDRHATSPQEHGRMDARQAEAMHRADAMLTDLGMRLGHWTARVRQEAARLTARTREELEDVWAEAQAVRHRQAGTLARVDAQASGEGPDRGPDGTGRPHARRKRPSPRQHAERRDPGSGEDQQAISTS